jgi:hypothetical protein
MKVLLSVILAGALAVALASTLAEASGAGCPVALGAPVAQTTPRTSWGDPDLQGVWSGADSMAVPLDRAEELGSRNVLTEEEFRARRVKLVEGTSSSNIEATNFGAEPEIVQSTSRQASLIVDPPNGRRPPRVPAADPRAPSRTSFSPGIFASVADLGGLDRCIASGTVPTMQAFNGIEIVQAPGYVAIRTEVIHEARVISLDGRAHLGESIATYAGDSRGRWEGRTLVVETTNLNGRSNLSGNAGERPTTRTTVIERYSLTDRDLLRYEATIDDPGTWTRPWTIAFPRTRDSKNGLYEYACHEGNYSVRHILSASRAAESPIAK